MDKKTSNDVAKVLLIIGIIIWVLSCCLAVVIDLSLDSWLFIFIGIAILSPMIASGYIYSKNIKNVITQSVRLEKPIMLCALGESPPPDIDDRELHTASNPPMPDNFNNMISKTVKPA